ncbi:MAG: DUF2147 domain-containing protein [Saprospiraceae bacterium]
MFRNFLILVAFSFISATGFGQTLIGIWKNLDDSDGKEKSHIQIYEKDGKFRAKVIKLLPGATITKCTACTGINKDKDIVGMDIVWDMKKKGSEYDSGTILDPKSGKEYSCLMKLEGTDKLKVRGYLGMAVLGRTQYWYRVK